RQLADDFALDSRWLARQLKTVDADHLRRQLLGHARPGETCTKEKVKTAQRIGRRTRDRRHSVPMLSALQLAAEWRGSKGGRGEVPCGEARCQSQYSESSHE